MGHDDEQGGVANSDMLFLMLKMTNDQGDQGGGHYEWEVAMQ